MSLLSQFEEWREDITTDKAIDGEPPPSDEEVWRQVVFCAIADFLEANLLKIEQIDDGGTSYADAEGAIPEWLDQWAERKPGEPLPIATISEVAI